MMMMMKMDDGDDDDDDKSTLHKSAVRPPKWSPNRPLDDPDPEMIPVFFFNADPEMIPR